MKQVDRPRISITLIVDTCSSSYRDTELQKRFVAAVPQLLGHESEFLDRMEHKTVASMSKSPQTTAVTPEEAKDLYVNKLARKQCVGRPLYDRLLIREDVPSCPFCGQEAPNALDHYLPKSIYPYLAVAPGNLIPICSICNQSKQASTGSSLAESTYHPYFESIDWEWLQVELFNKNHELLAYYTVRPFESISDPEYQRLKNHFETFELGRRYQRFALNEIANGRKQWKELSQKHGIKKLEEELCLRYESCKDADSSSWQTALYHALSDNYYLFSQYCADSE